ncbi:siroheme synthase CysG [Xanthobacter agilis]|uniref:Uroporphyrin-III C-methyltransferase/precorrin-2 dehydrogenase/sirohydrochlorin ferrochelatase n=1 Tax=Xanthobacter agilis TaxID=47492 RepID=A0ABU0LIH6_XANAG|nr:siroheme synthase CysG [Xanthobacter agilis]MDQ0506946.1 uroporphyrin-III C-methyltransferase/precorrin-2 dehydrogenase/sirohydrochlorin ferrochelatase [Xanthobacter agilis]
MAISGLIRRPSVTPDAHMAPLARLPVFFGLKGRRVVVAGEGSAVAWKAELLCAAGARVEVFTPAPVPELESLTRAPPDGVLVLHPRDWRAEDLTGATLAVCAFPAEADAVRFADAARAAGVPVNAVDRPNVGDFTFGAIVNRSPLVVGISTDGAAPVFGQAVRAKIEALLPAGFSLWADAARAWRRSLSGLGLSAQARRAFWERFSAKALTEPNRVPEAADREALLAGAARVAGGSVVLVGAGPGDPELLTLKAVRALQSADVVLYDDLVSAAVLDFARREARKMLVGKTGYGPSCKQDDINAMMVTLAREGRRVVRLKGGEPMIFGRAGEEIAACRAAGIPVEVVPGISSAQGAASRLMASLTHRDHARRLQFVTAHARNGRLPEDLDFKALADPVATTVVYMPRHTLKDLVARLMPAGLDPSTPAVAVFAATRPEERIARATIATLAEAVDRAVDEGASGPCLVLYGHALAAALADAACDDTGAPPASGAAERPAPVRRMGGAADRGGAHPLEVAGSGL